MRFSPSFIAIAACCLLGSTVRAQRSGDSVTAEQNKQWADQAVKLALAEARSYEIHLGQDDGPRLKLSEQPALKWSNTYDAMVHGSVLVWTRDGRPEAIACMYKFFTVKTDFDAEFHSLAEGPLTVLKKEQVVWAPTEAGVEFKPVVGVATPAKTATGRLVQMRDIARDFTAELTAISKTKYDLRLMPQPLLRYGIGSGKLLDGAIFAYARATDPDVLLLLEARAADGKNPRWEFALGRMHVGALQVKYRDKEVWSVNELTHPYFRMHERYTTFQKLPEPQIDPAPGATGRLPARTDRSP